MLFAEIIDDAMIGRPDHAQFLRRCCYGKPWYVPTGAGVNASLHQSAKRSGASAARLPATIQAAPQKPTHTDRLVSSPLFPP